MLTTGLYEVDWRNDPRYAAIVPAAVLVACGPDGAPTFVRQKGGPFAGRWMLPGGSIERGEFARDAAVRELAEETGIHVPVDAVDVIGGYEIIGATAPYHVLMFAFRARGHYTLPPGFVGDNGGGVAQLHPDRLRVHSTDHQILADAGLVDVPADVLVETLVHDQLRISTLR